MTLEDPLRRRFLAAGAVPAMALAAQTADSASTAPTAGAPAPLPQVPVGRIERLAPLASRHVAPRHVDVWLPRGYDGTRPHTVLYMHDGQMLFDASTTWNRQAWNVAPTLQRLIDGGTVGDTLVVGTWNAGADRYAEYYPEKFLAFAPEPVRREYVERASNGRSLGDAYLRFLVEELKPAIERRYATRTAARASVIAGASMGGLISLYALAEYPEVFGAAAALSTHWVGRPTSWGLERVRNAALPLAAMSYLSQQLPSAGRHRLYSDRGDDALDALYAPAHALFADLVRDRGYTAADAATPIVAGTGHNETDWAQRLGRVLAFAMPPR